MDIILRKGEICEGSGSPLFRADVGISHGKIIAVGDLPDSQGRRTIDAEGLVITPGFIDIHSHTDENILVNRQASSKVFQGVTTELVGNCGYSPAPLYGEFLKESKAELENKLNLEITWRTCSEFFSLLSQKKIGLNYLMLAGNANLRGGVIGYEKRKAGSDELDGMKSRLAQALEEGAWGISSGLIYVPSSFSDKEELVSLAKVVADFNGIYSTHMRGEGDSLLEAIQEAIDIAGGSGVRLQISHLKASGRNNWAKMDLARHLIEKAKEGGVDIACDHYPYCASSTGLDFILPDWMREGGQERFVSNLKDVEKRARASAQLKEKGEPDWTQVILSSVKNPERFSLLGKSIDEVSSEWQKLPLDTVMDLLLLENGDVSIVHFAQSEENVRKVMSYPFSMFGSDAAARSPRGPLAEGLPHPRAYGTYPRVLGHYVRELNILSLEEAIRKMTGLPASRLGLSSRGLIREGFWADITIFNRDTIREKATYKAPHQFPEGIEYVIINGETVVEHGEHTGALPGMVLKRGQ